MDANDFELLNNQECMCNHLGSLRWYGWNTRNRNIASIVHHYHLNRIRRIQGQPIAQRNIISHIPNRQCRGDTGGTKVRPCYSSNGFAQGIMQEVQHIQSRIGHTCQVNWSWCGDDSPHSLQLGGLQGLDVLDIVLGHVIVKRHSRWA